MRWSEQADTSISIKVVGQMSHICKFQSEKPEKCSERQKQPKPQSQIEHLHAYETLELINQDFMLQKVMPSGY